MAVLVTVVAAIVAPSVVHAQDYPPTALLLADQAIVAEGGISDDPVRRGIVLLTIGGMAILASRSRWRRLLPTRSQ